MRRDEPAAELAGKSAGLVGTAGRGRASTATGIGDTAGCRSADAGNTANTGIADTGTARDAGDTARNTETGAAANTERDGADDSGSGLRGKSGEVQFLTDNS